MKIRANNPRQETQNKKMDITVKKMYLRVSPRKVRPVLWELKKQPAEKALAILKFSNKAVSQDLYGLVKSGVAAFKFQDLDTDKVFVKNLRCDEGSRLKRRRIVSKGRASAIQKRMCHLVLTLSDEKETKKAEKPEIKAEAKEKSQVKAEKEASNTKTVETKIKAKASENIKDAKPKAKAKKASKKQVKE